jgi:ribosome-binding factor A
VSQRTERIDELLREEIGAILTREVTDPRIGFATVTEVETTPDLRHARVWVSVIGQRAERDETIAALGRAMPFVRRQLYPRLRLKRIPELHVRLDDSAERGTRVLHLLQELETGQVPEDEPAVGESLPTPVARLPQPDDAPEPVEGVDPAAEEPFTPARRPRRGPGTPGRPTGRSRRAGPSRPPGRRGGRR